jgi:hypothetical protein
LAEVVHRYTIALLPEGELRVFGREQHLMVDAVDQPAGDLLQNAEIQYEESFLVEGTFDRHADTIVVSVECLALVTLERDKVG